MLKVALSGKVRGSLVNHVTSFLNLATTRTTRRYEAAGIELKRGRHHGRLGGL